MHVEFDLPAGFAVRDNVIRELPGYGEGGKRKLVPHLQALVLDTRKHRTETVECALTYYDQHGTFLGFDSASIWTHREGPEMPVSMAITIPQGTERAVVNIREPKRKPSEALIVGGLALTAVTVVTILAVLRQG